MSTITGHRPGTRTAAEDYKRATEEAHKSGGQSHGKLSNDPVGVFEARQKAGPHGERDFSNDPARAGQASRKMGLPRRGRI
jgi:general stress protein YciG